MIIDGNKTEGMTAHALWCWPAEGVWEKRAWCIGWCRTLSRKLPVCIFLLEERRKVFRFWFRYIYRYSALIELQNMQALEKIMREDYTVFSGIALERWFRQRRGSQWMIWLYSIKIEISLCTCHENTSGLNPSMVPFSGEKLMPMPITVRSSAA